MAELGGVVGELRGSLQNRTGDDRDAAGASRLAGSAGRGAASVWRGLRGGRPGGGPRAACRRRVVGGSAGLDTRLRRGGSDIVEDAVGELGGLADYTPGLPGSGAGVLALRLCCIGLADGVPPGVAQDGVSGVFLVGSRTVQGWTAAWESNHRF